MLGPVSPRSNATTSDPPSRGARASANGVGLGTMAMALAALSMALVSYFLN